MVQNGDLVCALCGGEDAAGKARSTLTLAAGYGSQHDMDRLTVPICGECCDWLFSELSRCKGTEVESPPW